MLNIIIVDDHRMFRESLRKIITIENIAVVMAEASNGIELLKQLKEYKPDLILMDIVMPEMDGIEATKKVRDKYPGIKILVLSSYGDEKYYYRMIELGTKGFILKTAGISELQKAIVEIENGGNWFSAELIQNVIVTLHNESKKNVSSILTEREIEIVKLISQSLTNEQIAEKLNLSFTTIKWHRANLLSKTACVNSVGLVMYAIKHKLI
jgi:DNA-binding NarL/FixJ family response regulator